LKLHPLKKNAQSQNQFVVPNQNQYVVPNQFKHVAPNQFKHVVHQNLFAAKRKKIVLLLCTMNLKTAVTKSKLMSNNKKNLKLKRAKMIQYISTLKNFYQLKSVMLVILIPIKL
jgi:hypothetical protein